MHDANHSEFCVPKFVFFLHLGKIQRLRALLREFISCSNDGRRPRVIFLITHQAALLDILEAWFPSDPFLTSIRLLRVPIDHLDNHRQQSGGDAVEVINSWPVAGIQGPLVVLLHARSPAFALAGLQAGPDTRVVIADADWRVDVVDTLRTK